MGSRCKNINGGILEPGCDDGKWERTLVILYEANPLGGFNKDVFRLCAKCAKCISDNAKAQGYRTNLCD